jgi:hypothetical protein
MLKWNEGKVALGALIFFAFWLFVVLPFLNAPDKASAICADVEKLGFWQKTRCDPIAYFTLWLMISTAVLGAATIGLWVATIWNARIAERAGIQLRIKPASGLPPPNSFYVELFWENVGRAPALVEGCDVKFADKDDLPAQPDYSNCVPLNTDRTVPVGGRFQTNQIGPSVALKKNGQPINYVLFGRMRYRELNGRSHETGFAIEIAPFMPAFMAYPNRAYEYYT